MQSDERAVSLRQRKEIQKCCLGLDNAMARKASRRPPAAAEDQFTAEILPNVDKAVDRILIRVKRGSLTVSSRP